MPSIDEQIEKNEVINGQGSNECAATRCDVHVLQGSQTENPASLIEGAESALSCGLECPALPTAVWGARLVTHRASQCECWLQSTC